MPANFNKLSKNAKILKIGPIEAKIWKNCHYDSILHFIRNWRINSAFFTELIHTNSIPNYSWIIGNWVSMNQFRKKRGIDASIPYKMQNWVIMTIFSYLRFYWSDFQNFCIFRKLIKIRWHLLECFESVAWKMKLLKLHKSLRFQKHAENWFKKSNVSL